MNWEAFYWSIVGFAVLTVAIVGFVAFWAWLSDYIGIWAPIIGTAVIFVGAAIALGLVVE